MLKHFCIFSDSEFTSLKLLLNIQLLLIFLFQTLQEIKS